MNCSQRISSFNDTWDRCTSDDELIRSITRSRKGQKIYTEKDEMTVSRRSDNESARIIVSKKRTFEAASAYKGHKICVLNFANAYVPGGGVENGAQAQEESLCRCSTLFACIIDEECKKKFYGPHNDSEARSFRDLIYTPGVTVFKDDSDEHFLDEKDWFSTDVISCAAPSLLLDEIGDDELLNFHEFMFERMFIAAINNDIDVMILGAFGCGVFSNDPKIVSKAAKNALHKYANHFKTIEFAVFCRDYETDNYTAFRDQFVND